MELVGTLRFVLLSTSGFSALVVVEVVEPAGRGSAVVLAILCSSAACSPAPMPLVSHRSEAVLRRFVVEDLAANDLDVFGLG